MYFCFFFFFFFQAEDGIRDLTVTGVQTCALPISHPCHAGHGDGRAAFGCTDHPCCTLGRRELPEKSETFQTHGDRKSTRLNSSHSQISYAVFCLKKKKKKKNN